jgi:subtilase family serine protease
VLLTATADAANQVVESNEANNGASYAPDVC